MLCFGSFCSRLATGADAESLYGTAGAPLCKDAADFLPEREMWAWCDFYAPGASMPDETRQALTAWTCIAFASINLRTRRATVKRVATVDRAGATGVGGIWNAQTCAMEVDKFRPCQKVPE